MFSDLSSELESRAPFDGARHVRELLVVDLAVVQVDAGDQAVLEAADPALVGDAREAAVVVVAVVEPLEDRVHQVAVDHEAADLHAGRSATADDAVLLAMRQESMLRCQSLATLMAAAVFGEVSATVLVTLPGMRCMMSLALK